MGDLEHYLDCYVEKNFIEEYKEYLQNPSGVCPYYIDIDSGKNKDFYNDLEKFLSIMLGPGFVERTNKKIKYQYDEGKYINLTSDQFGFSAPYKEAKNKKSTAWNGEKSYPYARYLSIKRDDDKGAEDIVKSEFVAECIYETRTIGGSFIWPTVKRGRAYQSIYNLQRGIKGYVEDRVDITLYEISCFYSVYSRLKEKNYESFIKDYTEKYSGNILFIRQCEEEKQAIYQWLAIFETFKGYIEKLKFGSFVILKNGVYLIRDMASKGGASQLDITEIKKIRDMNYDELHTLLMNVKNCTQTRSREIWELLEKKDI